MRLFERKGLSLGSGLISVWGNLRPPPSLPHPHLTLTPTALTTDQGSSSSASPHSAAFPPGKPGICAWLVWVLLYVKMEGWSTEGRKRVQVWDPGSFSVIARLPGEIDGSVCCAFPLRRPPEAWGALCVVGSSRPAWGAPLPLVLLTVGSEATTVLLEPQTQPGLSAGSPCFLSSFTENGGELWRA
jgi:hypothetical protein